MAKILPDQENPGHCNRWPLLEGSRSPFVLLNSDIQQGSVQGPILFTIYTAPIDDICKKTILNSTSMQMILKFTYHYLFYYFYYPCDAL